MFSHLEIADIFKIDGDSPTVKAAVLNDEDVPGEIERPYVQSVELEKLSEGKFTKAVALSWDEIVSQPLEKNEKPKDGMTEERCGRQNWRYFHKDGKCIRIELEDPDVDGGKMLFDGEGNEIAA